LIEPIYEVPTIAERKSVALLQTNNEGTSVAVHFPNESRSYDRSRQTVMFWGYDGVIEKVFSIPVDALLKIRKLPNYDEASLLDIFDTNRETIYAAAAKLYSRRSSGPYYLAAANF
jgi:hypothetical protein